MLLLTVVVNWIFFIGASVMSVMAFVNMAIDKRRAENGGWRIAERKLLMQTMAGGFFGTFLAMIFLVSHDSPLLLSSSFSI